VDIREYYQHVFPKLARGFQHCHYVLGFGQELIAHGWDPNGLLVTVEPIDHLWDLTVEKGLEVFIPVVGHDSSCVVWPFDFEVYLADATRLYACTESQQWFFHNNIGPVAQYLTIELESRGVPHVLDFTPSGGHFLTRVLRGGRAWDALASIGYVDDGALPGYDFEDPNDLKRNPRIHRSAALVFSGLGFISEFLALRTLQAVGGHTDLPITIWDTRPACMNLDLSWTADPAYMRIIRAPFSAHKKRSQRFRMGPQPLVDVMGRYYDGHDCVEAVDLSHVVDCMWDMDLALHHAEPFPGYIPFAEEGMVQLVQDYLASPLRAFHDFCHHGEHDLAPGEAVHRALNDGRLSHHTQGIVKHPYPRMLQPAAMRSFVAELRLAGWHPRHIKCLLADRYHENHGWGVNFMKYNPELKAWAFARQYSERAHFDHDGWRI